MGHASPRPPGPELEAVLSVTLASPVLGGNGLPPGFLETLRAPYTKGGNEVSFCRFRGRKYFYSGDGLVYIIHTFSTAMFVVTCNTVTARGDQIRFYLSFSVCGAESVLCVVKFLLLLFFPHESIARGVSE